MFFTSLRGPLSTAETTKFLQCVPWVPWGRQGVGSKVWTVQRMGCCPRALVPVPSAHKGRQWAPSVLCSASLFAQRGICDGEVGGSIGVQSSPETSFLQILPRKGPGRRQNSRKRKQTEIAKADFHRKCEVLLLHQCPVPSASAGWGLTPCWLGPALLGESRAAQAHLAICARPGCF